MSLLHSWPTDPRDRPATVPDVVAFARATARAERVAALIEQLPAEQRRLWETAILTEALAAPLWRGRN